MSKKSILVIGDIMVDRYTYVQTQRNAPEAKIPVWDTVTEEDRPGGAANVALNLLALGSDEVEVFLAGIADKKDVQMLSRRGINTYLCHGYETMVKHRFVNKDTSEYLFRSDNFQKFSQQSVELFEKALDHFIPGHKFDAVVFSDYDKGTLTKDMYVQVALGRTDLVVVDSKRVDLSMYAGSQVLKVNEEEYSRQVSKGPYTSVESLFDYVVVTKGKNGSELRQQERSKSNDKMYVNHVEQFPVISVNAKDVTGCGDTHTAAMTFALLKSKDIRMAVKFGNACARNVVQKFGTSVVEVSSEK